MQCTSAKARHNRSPARECWGTVQIGSRVPLGTAGFLSRPSDSSCLACFPRTYVLGYGCDALRALGRHGYIGLGPQFIAEAEILPTFELFQLGRIPS